MASVYGPDKLVVPTGPDAPDVPATIITLLDSMRPSLIGHASSIADRTAKYGRASASSIQAPAGTVVVSAEMSAIWMKSSDSLDQWATIVQHSDPVRNTGQSFVNSDVLTVCRNGIVPDTGIYSVYAYASEESGAAVDDKIRECEVAVNGSFIFGGSTTGSYYWRWTGARTLALTKGDKIEQLVQQRSGAGRTIFTELTYQRIL
ncbi:hypothetical protein FAM23868_002001 [Propionibacterium freudenreichii]|uniref:hypothetical protein n=1 Tax=Propionibacterium freudenreichii TaxID=1744 RepID=UPI00254EF423|nr:hypothetical protein [Propionibacterium freudenreichii]MDK9332661.1 hypothetical protein [Propionibacterium freudenreichii]